MSRRFSVVVPVYRNESTLVELHDRLSSVLGSMTLSDYEMVFVDDASPDGSWPLIEHLSSADPHVVGLRLESNVGQLRALCAGLDVARGDVLATMDADLEHPPEALPRLVQAFDEGHELVVGQRIGHSTARVRVLASLAMNLLVRALRLPVIGVGSSFLVGTPRVAAEMRRLVEQTGRQMVLRSVFDSAHDPTVVELELSTHAESAYTFQRLVRLGVEFLAGEVGPRIARLALLVAGCVLILGLHAPWRRRTLGVAGSIAGLGLVALLMPCAIRGNRTESLYRVISRVGEGLSP